MNFWQRILDSIARRFDSILNSPFEVKYIWAIFGLGSSLLAGSTIYLIFTDIKTEINFGENKFTLEALAGPELLPTFIGAFFVGLSFILFWKHINDHKKSADQSELLKAIKTGIDKVSDYEIESIFEKEHKFRADAEAIRILLSSKNTLSNILKYKKGFKHLIIENSSFRIKSPLITNIEGIFGIVFYIIFALLALGTVQLTIYGLGTSNPPSLTLLTLIITAFAVASYGSLTVYFNTKAARDLAPTNSDTNKEKQSLSEQHAPESSTVFFYDRFASSFPGVRNIQWFDTKEAIKRLSLFFREPLRFKKEQGYMTPIWYWRGGNYHINKYSVLNRKTILIDHMELCIRKIAAVNQGSYYQSFIYIEADAMKPTGLYPRTESEIKASKDYFGYVTEEYGLYKNKHFVSRAEYDDNSAVIKGKVTELNNDVELRERFITPYNIIIAPHGSPINNNAFDKVLVKHMNEILENKDRLEALADKILKLPRRDFEI